MRKALLPASFFALSLSVLSACMMEGRSCTLIGCLNAVRVSWDKPISGYTAKYRFPGDSLRTVCSAAAYPCQDTTFHVEYTGPQGNKPNTVFLQILTPTDSAYFEGDVALAWGGDYYPNGKECDVTPCQSASVKLDLE